MKKRQIFFIFLIIFFFFPFFVHGKEINNKFGIHLAQPHPKDIDSAAALVNSHGGDWGYITLVIEEKDRGVKKWQDIFDSLRRLHLIPIIRIATSGEGSNWRQPTINDADSWVSFLGNLNWVVKNRYVILFNEPNHSQEWGGKVDPQSYAKVIFNFAKKLKEKDNNFFIMMAGFDASAPNQPPKIMSEEFFLKKMMDTKTSNSSCKTLIKCINQEDLIDGWSSHSYPNPGFSNSPYHFGRGTVRGYQWELSLLKELGLKKKLPVFITETGWKRGKYLNENKIADYFEYAFKYIWLPDKRVKAVTPFIINYQQSPFLGFSWQKYNSNKFYQQYYQIQSLSKIKGEPKQIDKGKISLNLPKQLLGDSNYHFNLEIINLGQAIWNKDNYYLAISNGKQLIKNYSFSLIDDLFPFKKQKVNFDLKTKEVDGFQEKNISLTIQLSKNKSVNIQKEKWLFKILPLPSLRLNSSFFLLGKAKGTDFEVQIFDKKERLVFKKKKIAFRNSQGEIKKIKNVILGERYRIVLLKPYFLPRQTFIVFKTSDNLVQFKPLLFLDFNKDGKFNLQDLLKLFKD